MILSTGDFERWNSIFETLGSRERVMSTCLSVTGLSFSNSTSFGEIRIEKHKGEISRADKEKIDELAAFVEYIELSPRAAGRNPIFAMSLWGEIMKIAPMDRL